MRERFKLLRQKKGIRMWWVIVAIATPTILGVLWWAWLLPDRVLQPDYSDLNDNEKASLAHQYRGTLISGVGTIATVIGGVFLFLNFRLANKRLDLDAKKITQDAALAEDRLISERFVKAVEQLGHENSVHIRLGGIYSLGRLAEDSDEMHQTVLDVLSAFIREKHSKADISTKAINVESDKKIETTFQSLATDVTAALTVIGNRKKDTDFIDLSDTAFNRAELMAANFSRTILSKTDLSFANLSFANLESSSLRFADLSRADLSRANLNSASLVFANLSSTKFSGAKSKSADLRFANLSHAKLYDADLSDADFSSANLRFADLRFANLGRTDFSSTNLNDASLSDADLSSANLRFADLSRANLNRTNLNDADLIGADLSGANLCLANLNGADLYHASLNDVLLLATDLRNTKNLTSQQLQGNVSPFLCNVALPPDLEETPINPNEHCDRIPQLLSDRYDISLEEAQLIVDKARQKQWD